MNSIVIVKLLYYLCFEVILIHVNKTLTNTKMIKEELETVSKALVSSLRVLEKNTHLLAVHRDNKYKIKYLRDFVIPQLENSIRIIDKHKN